MAVTWTKEQQKVIDLRDRNILVSAAAGSGKTAVLVERIIAMITDEYHPVDIDQLLVVTFTKAAAAEMKERIAKALEKKKQANPKDDNLERQIALVGNAQITTIHSFCLHVIRNHFNEIDLDPSFRVADDTELALLQADTISGLLEDMYAEGDPDFLSFVECYARGKTDQNIESLVMQLYHYSRSYPWPEEWLNSCIQFLNPESEEALENSELMLFLKDYIQSMIYDLMQQTAKALAACREPGGPYYYEDALKDDYVWFRRVSTLEKLSQIRDAFSEVKWTPLSRKKMENVSAESKEIVKNMRKSVKDRVTEMQKDFFFTDMGHMLSDIQMTARPMAALVNLVKEFSRRFQALKEEKNIVDFGDLEHFALDILIRTDEDGNRIKSGAAIELRSQYREILCDEYQDSNLVQETILKAVSREDEGTPNIFMVGDVKQSIYKFRLARPELFMEKYNNYPTTDHKYQRIDLHKNFRSRGCVVDFVNLIFTHIMGEAMGGIVYDEHAALNKGADFPEVSGEDHEITEVMIIDMSRDDVEAQDEDEENLTSREVEARAVALRIQQMIKENQLVFDRDLGEYRPIQYRDIVVLLRTMKGWSDVFVDVLTDVGIPSYSEISSGFFDTVEIRTAICILSVIDNPLQDIELAAVLKSCIGRFSDEDLAMIRSVLKKGSLYDACLGFLKPEADMILEHYFDAMDYLGVRARLKDFLDMLDKFRIQSAYMNIHQLILSVFEETHYDDYISAMPFGQRRHANLELFIEKAVEYERTSYKGLFNFVRYIKELRTQNSDIGEASVFGEDENAVRIVSIHKSKGLEYPVVFISGMNKQFNKQDTRSSILIHSDYGLGPEAVHEASRSVSPTIYKKALAKKITLENLSEELRVLYVALTRAKERLILTGTVKNFAKEHLKWCSVSGDQDGLILFKDLSSASCYFDWVMPVLYNDKYRKESNAKVDIKSVPMMMFVNMQAEEIVGNQIRKASLLTDVESERVTYDAQRMNQRFGWIYPHLSSMQLPAKLTITEIKRMNAEVTAEDGQMLIDETENEKILYEEAQASDSEPVSEQDMQQRIEAAARRGSAMHKLLEIAVFARLRCLDDVKMLISDAVSQGYIDTEIAEQINPWKIYMLVNSELGSRMDQAQRKGRFYREKQFIMALPAADIYKDKKDIDDEMILTQGIIDAYFEEPDGIVLIDYKTDYVPKGAGQILVDRYKVQLDYYQKALENMLHKTVKEKYIYSFSLQEAIKVD